MIDREACVIQSGSGATTSDCSSPTLDVGYDGSITLVTYRTLLQFNPGQSVPHGVTITNATLSVISYGLYGQTDNGSCFVDAMQVTQPWTSGVTWDTTDGSTPWSTAGGSFDATPVASRTFCPSPYSYPNDYWNVTSLVQAWIEGAAPDDGILLKTQDETASDVHEFDNGSFDNGQASGAATYYTYVPSGTLIDQRAPTGTDYYLFDGLGNVVALTDSTGAGGPLLPGPGDARDDPRGGVGALHRLRGE